MVTALIRELITSGELAPGSPLRQRDLAARCSVSQTPVREAMRRLEAEGLVIGDTHRGFTVPEAASARPDEITEIRLALESLVAKFVVDKVDDNGVRQLVELNEILCALPEGDSRYDRLDRNFHVRVYEYSGSALLVAIMRLVWHAADGGRNVRLKDSDANSQHVDFLDALARRDSAAMTVAMREHVTGLKEISNHHSWQEGGNGGL
jgi:DNA-binding GntR family transcriptional regulator